MRNRRDATLSMHKLILPAIQVNIDGGWFPEAEVNGGIHYLNSSELFLIINSKVKTG